MDLYNYLLRNYGYDEPVFIEELTEELNATRNQLQEHLKQLIEEGKIEICKFDSKIYFIPDPNSILKQHTLSLDKIIRKQYLHNGKRIGYETGFCFANSLMLTTQCPSVLEIVTEKENSDLRWIEYNKRRFILSKPKAPITENNYRIFQVLDLLENFKRFSEVPFRKALPRISNYIKDSKICRNDLDRYLSFYPNAASLFLGSGLYDEITRNSKL